MKLAPLALSLLLAAAPAVAADDVSKVNGSITAEAGTTYGSLDTVNGSIKVADGVTTQAVETVNGGIRIGDGARTRAVSTVNGGIRIGRDVQVDGSIKAVNGSIFTDRGTVVRGSVETVNGGIGLVRTQLDGGVETVNGDITVGVGSQLGGGITVRKPGFSISFTPTRKPRVIVGPDAVVNGALRFDREVVLYVHSTARIGTVTGATAIRFDTDTAPQD